VAYRDRPRYQRVLIWIAGVIVLIAVGLYWIFLSMLPPT
jgi:hypothetical protein